MHRPRDKIENETPYELANESIFQSPSSTFFTRGERGEHNYAGR